MIPHPHNNAAAEGLPPTPPTVAIHTHGCKLNQSDSQELARQFEAAGYRVTDAPGTADVVVLNTCTVTAAADAKARQFLRKINRSNPGAVLVATGCYVQRDPAALAAIGGVSLVLNNTRKPELVAAVDVALSSGPRSAAPPAPASAAPVLKPEFTAPAPLPAPVPLAVEAGEAGARINPGINRGIQRGVQGGINRGIQRGIQRGTKRTRAMVKIQEGCDQVCAYCIVPKVRGRERSIPPEIIVAQIAARCSEGYREVVLTGTQLGSYGFDLQESRPGASLPGLLRRVLEETTLDRLRVSSLQAHEITPELLGLWESPRLCPHFHIPLQSGSDAVLRAMRRRYDAARFASAVGLTRRAVANAAITTDIIVGFPGEGPQEFEEGLELARSMAFSDIHAFPYSARPGTSAAHFRETVDPAAKRERMGRMLALAAESHRRFREGQLGTVRPVLWEPQPAGPNPSHWSGLTDNYIRVRAESERNLANAITQARLTGHAADWVTAQII